MKRRPLFIAGLAFGALAFAAHAHRYKVGEIDVGHPHARATAPGQPTGGAYLRLENRGTTADRLLSASTDVVASVEMHEMKMDGDVMRMRQVDAIDLPAKQAVVLAPGGLHLMLIGLKAPLKAGDRFPLTLRFEKAGEVKVEVTVDAPKAN
jgi:hypothetical protein